MENTPNTSNLSELPLDILGSLFERLSFVDFHRAKMVCSNWFCGSKQTVPHKSGSPWLILSLDDGGCVLYNPDEDKVYRSLRVYSGTRFLANSGKWFLVVDSRSNLYIIDVFSEKRIDLPPLESFLSTTSTVKRVGDEEFKWQRNEGNSGVTLKSHILRGVLWVDEKTEEYIVVCFFDYPAFYLSFCKKGDDHYTDIPLYIGIPKLLQGLSDLVLRGHRLYLLATRAYLRVLDLSGQKGFVDVTGPNLFKMTSPRNGCYARTSFAVTAAGEVLLLESITTTESQRSFHLYKKDPNVLPNSYLPHLHEVGSLGDEALLLDLGITVPANHTLGIEPNSIYFTHHGRAGLRKPYNLDICVVNLETKTLNCFNDLANMSIKDARWFLPMT